MYCDQKAAGNFALSIERLTKYRLPHPLAEVGEVTKPRCSVRKRTVRGAVELVRLENLYVYTKALLARLAASPRVMKSENLRRTATSVLTRWFRVAFPLGSLCKGTGKCLASGDEGGRSAGAILEAQLNAAYAAHFPTLSFEGVYSAMTSALKACLPTGKLYEASGSACRFLREGCVLQKPEKPGPDSGRPS